MGELQIFSYNDSSIEFEVIGDQLYSNGNTMCKAFGKEIRMWTRLESTERYINALQNRAENAQLELVVVREGRHGGTWIHEKLILKLAQWLDVDFEIWCDEWGNVSIKSLFLGMHDRILHEIAIICRAEGLTDDLSYILAKSPIFIASRLNELRVDHMIVNIIAGWGNELTDKEVLHLLKSINDTGTI